MSLRSVYLCRMRRACRGKIRLSEKAARQSAASAIRRTGDPWEAYSCVCGRWHTGHSSFLAYAIQNTPVSSESSESTERPVDRQDDRGRAD